MQLKNTSLTALIILLASAAAPFGPNLPALALPLQVLSQNTDSQQQEADRLIKQGNRQLNTSKFAAALHSYQQALTIYQSIKDRKGEEHALNGLGIAYKSLGDYKQAIDYQQQSLAIARKIGDQLGESHALGNLGVAYESLGDYKQAIDYQQQSLAIKRKIGDQLGESHALGNLGLAYESLGDYKQAIDYHQQSLAIKRKIGDQLGEGASLGNLGLAYESLGDYKQAIDYHQQSLAIARKIGNKLGEGASLGNLGLAYKSLGDYKQAIDYQQQRLAIARKIGDKLGEGQSLNNLGLSLLYSEKLQAAETALRAGIEAEESLRAKLGNNDAFKVSIFETQASTYSLLQQVLIAEGKTVEALEIAEQGRARAFVELLAQRQRALPAPLKIQQIRQIAKQHNATLVEYSIVRDGLSS